MIYWLEDFSARVTLGLAFTLLVACAAHAGEQNPLSSAEIELIKLLRGADWSWPQISTMFPGRLGDQLEQQFQKHRARDQHHILRVRQNQRKIYKLEKHRKKQTGSTSTGQPRKKQQRFNMFVEETLRQLGAISQETAIRFLELEPMLNILQRVRLVQRRQNIEPLATTRMFTVRGRSSWAFKNCKFVDSPSGTLIYLEGTPETPKAVETEVRSFLAYDEGIRQQIGLNAE